MNPTWTKLNELKTLSLLLLIFSLAATTSFAQKSAGKIAGGTANKGGGGGGNPTPTPTPVPTPVPTNPLPQTPPAPDVIYRESFGAGPNILRPTGSKGTLKDTYASTPLQNFWIEYPGSKNTAWIAPAEGQTWRLCGASANPFEMYSPIQMTLGNYTNGCVISKWTDNPTQNPTALMSFDAPATAYEVSINGYPAPIDGKYLALGLTNSPDTYSNLANSDGAVLFLKSAAYPNSTLRYELRVGGLNGTLLASGDAYSIGWNQIKLRFDPVAKTVSANLNDVELGTFSLNSGSPRYVAFEGVAVADNFVIRKLQ